MNENKRILTRIKYCNTYISPSMVPWKLIPYIGGPVLGLFIGLLLGIILRDSQKLKAGMQFTY